MKKWGMAIIVIASLLSSGTGADALPTLMGSISYPAGIYAPAGTDWALPGNPTTLYWDVSYNVTAEKWTYMYTWYTPRKNLSHIILEVTPGAVAGDFAFSANELVSMDGIGIYSAASQGSSNPGMPEAMFGMKLSPKEGTTYITFSFETWRPPVWGDFYAKDGNAGPVYAYNTGFSLNDVDPTSNAGDGKHIVVPDGTGTYPTPEPGTLLLLGLGLIGIGIIMREMF